MTLNPNHKALILLLAMACMICWLVLSSCSVTKSKRSSRSQTDSVSSRSSAFRDSSSGGKASVSTSNAKETFDWSKLTIQYPRDTNITNIYNYPQKPATVIYETGRGTSEVNTRDSTAEWFKAAVSLLQASQDSLSRRMEEQSKDKKTAPNIWTAVIVLGLMYLVIEVVKWGAGKYSIVKK